jgi:hypothetical protein
MPDATEKTSTEATQKPKPFDPNNPDMTTPRRCRALTVKGIQCNQSAMKAYDYCIAHFERSPHTQTPPPRRSPRLLRPTPREEASRATIGGVNARTSTLPHPRSPHQLPRRRKRSLLVRGPGPAISLRTLPPEKRQQQPRPQSSSRANGNPGWPGSRF